MLRISAAACKVILENYGDERGGWNTVEWKGKDDPVTALDKEVNALVVSELERSFPGTPVIAEESDASTWDARRTAAEAFFVDPIDGTKDLIKRNGEFCVMLGLAENGRATAGVVAWPTEHRTFAAMDGEPAFEIARDGSKHLIHVAPAPEKKDVRVVVSRSHPDPKTLELLERLGMKTVRPLGSAGLKGVCVACGEADAYLHVDGGGKLWDACGPDVIVRAAGGVFTDAFGNPVDYRGELALRGTIAATAAVLSWLRS
jgi:3'(2'), 5'-bisphosphate nucleotidase